VPRKRTVKRTVHRDRPHTDDKPRENPPKRSLLKFGMGNAKLDNAIYTFSLPAGYSCPFARDCLSKAHRTTGRIQDGPSDIRCYAATMEWHHSVRRSRWHNFNLLRACKSTSEMIQLLLDSLSPYEGMCGAYSTPCHSLWASGFRGIRKPMRPPRSGWVGSWLRTNRRQSHRPRKRHRM
jgi:hypothetical protein